MHHVPGDHHRHRRQHAQDLHAGRVQAGLLLRLAQGRGHDVAVLGVDATAGERDLPGVLAQGGGALGQQHVHVRVHAPGVVTGGDVVEGAEQDQHGGGARIAGPGPVEAPHRHGPGGTVVSDAGSW